MENETPKFDVVCACCGERAVGHTVEGGTWGSYREVYRNYNVRKVTCGACGKILNYTADEKPKLWFYTEIDGCAVWSHNEERLLGLKEYLIDRTSSVGGYRDYLPTKF